MIRSKILLFFVCFGLIPLLRAQAPIEQFLQAPYMQGASFSLSVKEVESGKTVYSYDAERLLTPASVLKVVTTATALDVLGADYRFPTVLAYDGAVRDGVLQGNLYIQGSGDPSLGSAYLKIPFLNLWLDALQKAGIRHIAGSVIADERVFDTEGISPKWLREDIGNYYAAGCYGLSVFDNCYRLVLQSGTVGTQPVVVRTEPQMAIRFENCLETLAVPADSVYIMGMPFDSVRYLYGALPPGQERCVVKGDIPDPPLYLATYVTEQLRVRGIRVEGAPSCYRIEQRHGRWEEQKRTPIVTTYSPPLRELVKICNHVSHNLYADAFLKTIGLHLSSETNGKRACFARSGSAMKSYWVGNGLEMGRQQIFDGSGLAPTDKLSASFIVDLLLYMAKHSSESEAFMASLPEVGREGTVRNFLKGTVLEGHARLKSGSISGVRCYAGYLEQGGKLYAIAVMVNNYEGKAGRVTKALEQLVLQLAMATATVPVSTGTP